MQIQTIEQKTGLDRATIRYYEQEGLIKPLRLQNGYRDYSEKQLQDLLKIKLLRELGLSLEAILQLIEGKDDLQSVLGNQLVVLKEHKAQVDNAETICKMILQDKVTYETIVPNKYFNATCENKRIENEVVATPYTEYIYLESHPVRRYVGRYLDQLFTSALLMLIVVVFLRVRPFGSTQNSLLSVAALFLYMPINALFLCLLGTTPGKFVVGIYLKTPEGKNMSFLNALRREWAVFRYGMGFAIPIYNLVRLIKSCNIHIAGKELEWDYDCNADVLYTEWDTKRGVFSAILAILCVVSIGYSAVDAQLPKHRNADLTLAQFAENHNDFAKKFDVITYLSEEGEWYRPNSYPPAIIIDTQEKEEYWQFITDNNQRLEKIKVKIVSNTQFFNSERIERVLYTVLMSQPDVDITVVDSAVKKISEITFVQDLKRTEYNFNGVIVKMEIEHIYNTAPMQTKILIDITLP